MLAGEGLQPTSQGAKVRFDGEERTVIDGPFTEAKELVAGYWIWECGSREEATRGSGPPRRTRPWGRRPPIVRSTRSGGSSRPG
jgi:hypothetical protein